LREAEEERLEARDAEEEATDAALVAFFAAALTRLGTPG
jgi:hypothetical protein